MDSGSQTICRKLLFPLLSICFIGHLLPCLCLPSSATTDTIAATKSIRDGQTIVSAGKMFELGFFSPTNSSYYEEGDEPLSNSTNRYVGIWYYNIFKLNSLGDITDYRLANFPELTIVWVANRDMPLTDSTGTLELGEDGNLKILDGRGKSIWSTNTSAADYTSVKLMDNGNLDLIEGKSDVFLWQSFDHPSHTLLPGMKIGMNFATREVITLTPWKNYSDPAPGSFVFGMDPQGSNELLISEGGSPHWRSGIWNGQNFPDLFDRDENSSLFSFHIIQDNSWVYFKYSSENYSHIVMPYIGYLVFVKWIGGSLTSSWARPRCNGYCGKNSSCKEDRSPQCKCLPGFEPSWPSHWDAGDWTEGCKMKSLLPCGKESGFLFLTGMTLRETYSPIVSTNESDCRNKCLGDCDCSAYAYANYGSRPCLIWNSDLMDVQEGISEGEGNVTGLYLRLATSEPSIFVLF